MLIEFRVDNHRSIASEQVLTMEAGRVGDEDDPRPRRVEGHTSALLPVAALYGANASGKSNVLAALGFMLEAVWLSHRSWPPEGGVPRAPFAWGTHISRPSLFEATVLIGGVRHRYGFVANDERFVEEWLYAWPHGRRQIWFERDGDAFKFGEHLRGENQLVEQVTRTNALYLSAAAQHRHEQLTPLFSWFASIGAVTGAVQNASMRWTERWLRRLLSPSSGQRQLPLLESESEPAPPGQLEAFRALLRAADVGIMDMKLVETVAESRLRDRWPQRILVRHQSSSEGAWLPLEEESQGTLTLFRIGPLVLDALAHGTLLVIDELEASLHPLLALEIVRMFNDPATNPRNAQLIFATHDTNLLSAVAGGEPPLRRDQIWLTEKDNEGATTLYPLTDFKPRKHENLERGYLQGRYGAIPFLGELAQVAREE